MESKEPRFEGRIRMNGVDMSGAATEYLDWASPAERRRVSEHLRQIKEMPWCGGRVEVIIRPIIETEGTDG